MDNFKLPGFPNSQKQDIVKFHYFKGLPYSKRLILTLAFIFTGFILQVIFLKAWPGVPLLGAATILNLVVGYDSRTKLNYHKSGSEWVEVGMERIDTIENIQKRSKKWDIDGLDITNPLGCVTLFITVIILVFFSIVASAFSYSFTLGKIFFIDAFILIIPLWFNGIKRIQTQNVLTVKTKVLKALYRHFQSIGMADTQFKPSLMLAKNKSGKAAPTDVRFSITHKDMPKEFYGLQGQINLNNVQGTNYSYFYCVLVAQKGFGLEEYYKRIQKPKKITIKYQTDESVEVIVIRQTTSKSSGYYTDEKASNYIFDCALSSFQMILGI